MSGRNSPQPAVTLDEVIADNVRRLREQLGWRQADLAEAMHLRAGWSTSTVSWVESLRRRVDAAELVWLCDALGVSVDELLAAPGSTRVSMSGGLPVPLALLRRTATRGGAVAKPVQTPDAALVHDDERRAAARLGITADEFRAVMVAQFGRSLAGERDRRLGDVSMLSPRSVQAKRGHATRTIISEVSEMLNEVGLAQLVKGLRS